MLGVVVAVDVDLGDSVVNGGILRAGLYASLEPREDELQPVPLLDFVDELVDGEVASDGGKESFDCRFITVDV